MEYDKYYQLLTISHGQKTIKLKVVPSSKGVDISDTIKNHFNIPREANIVLTDDSGCDCVIDGHLETTNYTLHVMPPPSISSVSSPSASSTHSGELQWPAKVVRQTFMDFFGSRGHTFVKSSPVVPFHDPTLLFVNAGMNQFKDIFLGGKTDMKRAHNSQKCIRAGGKHNDLDDVGKDVYHHTFFEMLGNWSFRDYFKKEAISMAWELLVDVYKIDPSRLYATYFGGAKDVPADEEAKAIWKQFLPESHILPFGMKDNFWEMGESGPCGPCTEIHYDRIGGRDASKLVNQDDPDVLEIWNNVFMQFNREKDGSLRNLPSKDGALVDKPGQSVDTGMVDTGMGFERLTSVLQNKNSNYDTDIFMPLFQAIQQETGAPAYTGLLGKADSTLKDMAYRVVADHIRTLTFALSDGAHIEAQGRGHVLRRIVRRAVRYGTEFLKAKPGFFARLVPVVVQNFGDAFPELIPMQKKVQAELAEEENLFIKTLDSGLKEFTKITGERKAGGKVSGAEAALLYHTYGFPFDLTELMAQEKGLQISEADFNKAMDLEKEKSKGDSKSEGASVLFESAEEPAHLESLNIPPTKDTQKYEWDSVSQTGAPARAKVQALYAGQHQWLQSVGPGQLVAVILDKTSFYAESGGQTADLGILRINEADKQDGSKKKGSKKKKQKIQGEIVFNVVDCQVKAKYVLHVGRLVSGKLSVGDEVLTEVDYARRSVVAKNHTCTHLLNLALRQTIGETKQEGSLVDTEKLRFDFASMKGLSPRELEQITNQVSQKIQQRLQVHVQERDKEEAFALKTLRRDLETLKGYSDQVRVVSVGLPPNQAYAEPENPQWMNFSVELCGGTHIANSGEIEDFCIVSEEGISRGVRRVVGLTANKAREAKQAAATLVTQIQEALRLEDGPSLTAVYSSLCQTEQSLTLASGDRAHVKVLLKELSDKDLKFKKEAGAHAEAEAIKEAEKAGADAKAQNAPYTVLFLDKAAGNSKALQKAQTKFSEAAPATAVFLFSSERKEGGKGACLVVVPHEKQKTLPANEWMSTALAAAGGKGGGKPGKAVGAVRDCTGSVDAVKEAALAFAKGKL
eukprot:gb/GEZN01001083.1/.p1 GENE.gb/GEZN01001083.1/~~gb/GEZN01001083.1/.p1  ORF type:complete len:1079 (-),score=263.95 gb/GEZN01001083.1/:85-3321(-)